MTTTENKGTPRAVRQLRDIRALVRKLDEEYVDLAVKATLGNMGAKIRADEIQRIIQRIEACLR